MSKNQFRGINTQIHKKKKFKPQKKRKDIEGESPRISRLSHRGRDADQHLKNSRNPRQRMGGTKIRNEGIGLKKEKLTKKHPTKEKMEFHGCSENSNQWDE